MLNQNWLNLVQKQKVIAVIRCGEIEKAYQMAKAVAAGGIQMIEITWNSDRPAELISKLRLELPVCTIGAGTLVSLDDMASAITSGAQFLFTPHTNQTLIQAAVDQSVPIIPGAFSPTEIITAWDLGASCVKVFPIQALGGASYIRSLKAPLDHIPVIPTGGVTLENAQEFITAGAIAVGVSSELFPKQLLLEENWQAIAQRAKNLMQQLQGAVNEQKFL